ncbi:peptide deformylase [Wenzhouxiangella marina]|uniref:Peptide deformylase n=1 Tax=Wenzhouxiangella marina TaxID=1579979 RepID=A0A0K0XSV4_9GAMM|nr:peptide deformylase [Wenzhouxiangella marina]AKS40701.1 peptide deformylase [Wenzhouxiangella marina]MBB6088472.1 peptide deformylase [Wenzhouxiangella marina]
MSRLTILEFPDPRLRRVAKPVDEVTENERQLADDMLETMYEARGIGLAATQVNQGVRVVVMDLSEDKSEPRVFINPEIIDRDGSQNCEEGCLSVPGVYAEVKRAERVKVRALDREGQPFELEADGLLAVCIQHEIDHLDGKVFVDYLSPLKRRMVEKRLKKQQRLERANA